MAVVRVVNVHELHLFLVWMKGIHVWIHWHCGVHLKHGEELWWQTFSGIHIYIGVLLCFLQLLSCCFLLFWCFFSAGGSKIRELFFSLDHLAFRYELSCCFIECNWSCVSFLFLLLLLTHARDLLLLLRWSKHGCTHTRLHHVRVLVTSLVKLLLRLVIITAKLTSIHLLLLIKTWVLLLLSIST